MVWLHVGGIVLVTVLAAVVGLAVMLYRWCPMPFWCESDEDYYG